MNQVIGALVASLIAVTTGAIALLSTAGVESVGDISQVQWIILLGGGLVTFLKDYQAITVRRLANKVTGTGDGGGSV